MHTMKESIIKLEHMPGKQLLEKLQQAIKGDVVYTVTIEPEQDDRRPQTLNIVPDFYDDESDSEEEINSILSTRSSTERNLL